MKKYIFLLALLFTGVLTGYSRQSAYLFVYFTGNRMSEEAIRMAVSPDGYNYYALNGNQPVIDSREISSTGGVRDPHILRCEDGKTFYMVVTDMVSANGWSSNRAMILLKSKDLINWTSNVVNIQKKYPDQEDLKALDKTLFHSLCTGSTIYLSDHNRHTASYYHPYKYRRFPSSYLSPDGTSKKRFLLPVSFLSGQEEVPEQQHWHFHSYVHFRFCFHPER